MSRRTKQWRKIAHQRGINFRGSNPSDLIPSERLVSIKSKRIITEAATPEKREIMLRAMTTPWEKSRR